MGSAMSFVVDLAPVAGIVLLVGGAIVAAYSLAFRSVDVKRVIALAGIVFFSGVFLVLYERVTSLELPASLGKITVQAKADAKEIREIRTEMEAQRATVMDTLENVRVNAERVSALAADMETQRQAVGDLVQEIGATASRVSVLATEIDSGMADLRESQTVNQKRSLANHLEILNREIEDLEQIRNKGIDPENPWIWNRAMIDLPEMYGQRDRLFEELDKLEEGASVEKTDDDVETPQ
jgi:septal ring factor EnvC (AmiA/AmiB activator)